MSKIVPLVLAIIKVVCGVILIGLCSHVYQKSVTEVEKITDVKSSIKAAIFGPVLCGLFVLSGGVYGILSYVLGGMYEVMYLTATAVAACCATGILWTSATQYSQCQDSLLKTCPGWLEGNYIGQIIVSLFAVIAAMAAMVIVTRMVKQRLN